MKKNNLMNLNSKTSLNKFKNLELFEISNEKKLEKQFNDFFLQNPYFRYGMSPIQESGIIDLSTSNYVVYFCNYVSSKGDLTFGPINFINGQGGEIIYLKVNSDSKYSFGSNMKFPSDYKPIPSKVGKVDIYSFMCLGPNEYLGTFAFNYS